MRTILITTAFVLASAGASAQVVGKVDNLLIVKTGKGYEIKPQRILRAKQVRKKEKGQPKTLPARKTEKTADIYHKIVNALENGAGEPVYSRIYGFDVDRVLNKGNYFGAVVSGNVDGETLRKTFKYVVKEGNKYYVVGVWK